MNDISSIVNKQVFDILQKNLWDKVWDSIKDEFVHNVRKQAIDELLRVDRNGAILDSILRIDAHGDPFFDEII